MKKLAFCLKNQLFRPRTIQFWRQFEQEARLEPELRQKLIFQRAQNMVKTAFDHTDFYHKKYTEAGLSDGIIRSMEEFSQLPPLEKNDLRNHFDEMVNRSATAGDCRLSTTGGSTGIPVKVYHDKRIPLDAVGWFVLNEFGGDISDNAAFLMRYNPHRSRLPLNQILWYPTRRCFLDVTFLTEESWMQFYHTCCAVAPRYLVGYVGAVQEFAAFLEAHHLTLPSIRFAWTTAAPLSESNRAYMERIFQAPVYNQYGCCEVFWLACECRQKNGLHYFDTIRHFDVCDEMMRPVPDDTEGELLLTDFLNQVFPIIRYRNGDRVRKLSRTCRCGCRFPLMASVNGRMTDVIRFPDGSSVPGDFMTTLFDDAPDVVAGFQIVQHEDYSLTLRYVPGSEKAAEAVNVVCGKLRARFDKCPIAIRSEATDAIAHDRGKIRFVVSEIK